MRKAKKRSVEDDQDLGMEEECVVCEHAEEVGQEESAARVRAPPQKRRAVMRVESAETQDYVSESQGLEGIDDEENGGVELHPECSQRAAMLLAHVRQQMQ